MVDEVGERGEKNSRAVGARGERFMNSPVVHEGFAKNFRRIREREITNSWNTAVVSDPGAPAGARARGYEGARLRGRARARGAVHNTRGDARHAEKADSSPIGSPGDLCIGDSVTEWLR